MKKGFWDKSSGFKGHFDNKKSLNRITPKCCGSTAPLTGDVLLDVNLLQGAINASPDASKFSLKEWLTINNIGGGDCCSDTIELTVDQAGQKTENGELIPDQVYIITNPSGENLQKVVIKASHEYDWYSWSAYALFYECDYGLNTSTDANPGDLYDDIWLNNSRGGSYAIGDYSYYDNLGWRNKTGTNTDVAPPSDSTNWERIPWDDPIYGVGRDNSIFTITILPVTYVPIGDYYLGMGLWKKQEPIGQNEAYIDIQQSIMGSLTRPPFTSTVEFFRWGTGLGADINNHVHVGVLDNRNNRRTNRYNYIQGSGGITATDQCLVQGLWVEGANIVLSSEADYGGLAESHFYGLATNIISSSNILSAYLYAVAQAKINIAGTAEVDGLKVEGDITLNISGNAQFQDIVVHGGGTGSVITIGQDTNIKYGFMYIHENIDLTGHIQNNVFVTEDDSNLYAEVEILGNLIDFDSPTMKQRGRIYVSSEGATGSDILDTVANDAFAPNRYLIIPYGADQITIQTGGSGNAFKASAGVLPVVLDAANGDFMECAKTGSGVIGGIIGYSTDVRIMNVHKY